MSREKRFDVLVLGGGVIGSAVLHAVAGQGLSTALVERGMVAQGCTAHSGGIVRVFHADARLSDMAAASARFYRDFESQVGEPCTFTTTGFLYFPAPADAESARLQAEHLARRVPMEWWSAERVRATFPQVRTDSPAVFEPDAGYMSPPDVTRAFVRAAKRKGAAVYEGTEVRRLIRIKHRFAGVETSQGVLFADRVVLALGAHTPRFLDAHHVPHALWSQRIQVDVRRSTRPRGELPAWIDDVNDLNGRPHEHDKFLIGYPTHDRNFHDGPVFGMSGHSEVIEAMGRRRFDWVDATERHGSFASFDCYSEGGLGVADFIDDHRSLLLATGYSGGGFKLAPAVAQRIASALTQR